MTDEPTLDAEVDPRAGTAHGWPYPVASDPVAGGAAAIQALATMLEAWLQPGGVLGITGPAKLSDTGGNNAFTINAQNACVLGLWTQDPAPANRNWAIRQRYTALGMLEFCVSNVAGGDPNAGPVPFSMDASGRVAVNGSRPIRSHVNVDTIMEYVLGPGNVAPSYSVAYAYPFNALPVLLGDKDNPFNIASRSVSGFTVNNGGASGVQGSWHAMGQG